MAEIDDLDQWIQQNHATQQGSPEFAQNAARYRELRAQEKAAALPDAEAELRANRAANPGGFDATMNRVFTGAVTGIPDLGIAGYNAVARGVGYPGAQADYLGPKMIEAGGGGQMPADASATRKILEGAASALLGGGAGAAATAARGTAAAGPTVLGALGRGGASLATATMAPTVASHYGGEGGAYVADKLGLDKETGALVGSLITGGAAATAPGAIDRYRHNSYAGQAKPNAPEIAAQAERQGVEPTAGMLGNTDIQGRERQLSGSYGARDFIEGRRRNAREQISDAIDRIAEARGSTDAAPTRGSIGYDTAEVARTGAEDAANRSSQGQRQLMTRIGPRTDTDVSGVLAAMERIRNQTDPGTAAPVNARVDTMRQMLPRDPEGNVISTNVPYERVKDWRTNLRERGQNVDPVPGRFSGQIYDAVTGAMRDAGESQGVPPHFFDTVQGRTARLMGEGGPHEQLSAVAGGEPTGAFNYLKGGEQNPARLRMLQDTGNPAMDRVFGDYLRKIANDTISNPNNSAPGPRQYASRIESMHPEALDVIAGPQRAGVTDTAGLARSFDYPSSGTGLTRSTGGVADHAVRTLAGSEVLGQAGAHSGIPFGGPIGRLLGLGVQPAINRLLAGALEGPLAINALGGGAAPRVMNIQELAAALNAANSQQQGGPRRGVPR